MTVRPILVRTRGDERRRNPRAPLNLPARLRWPSPLGQLAEVCETLDVSRGGLLTFLMPGRRPSCRVESRLWVTFPFDSSTPLVQPETPARVVRAAPTPAGGLRVAIEFEANPRTPAGQCPSDAGRIAEDRRARERIRLALPIRVRLADSPWYEETMSVDVTAEGLMFCSARLYAVGETVYLTLPPGTILSRSGTLSEVPARVVRAARLPGTVEQQVALAVLAQQRP